MTKLRLDPRLLMFVVGTRAALAFGAGLLLATAFRGPGGGRWAWHWSPSARQPPFPRRWECSAAVNPWKPANKAVRLS